MSESMHVSHHMSLGAERVGAIGFTPRQILAFDVEAAMHALLKLEEVKAAAESTDDLLIQVTITVKPVEP